MWRTRASTTGSHRKYLSVTSHIALDKYGSFVWRQMDGKRNVHEISKLVSAQFGEAAEPLVPRLVKYIQILYQNKFIGYVKRTS